MKRFLLLTTFLLTLFSCSNDMEFNEHVFQVTKNSELWKASDFSVSINEDGFLSMVAVLNDEIVTLNLTSSEPGIYDLGTGSNSTAWYKDGNGSGFTSEYRGDGEVIIEEYDPLEQTFTGTFRFNAFSTDGDVVNFINGIFYKVPLVTETEVERLNELKATVDDSELLADEVTIRNQDGIIEVQGTSIDGRSIRLFLPETVPVGSHNMNEQSASGTYAIYGFANGTPSTGQFGTLFINEHDIAMKRIKGTFTFTTLLPNSVLIENGRFDIYY